MQLHTHTHTHTQHAFLFSFPYLEHSYSHLMEKEMATHSNVLAWKISRTEEPGRPHSVQSQRVRHNWAYTHIHMWTHQCSILTPDQQEPPSQPLSQPCRGQYLIRSLQAHIPDHWWHRPWRVSPGGSRPLRTVLLNQAWVLSQETCAYHYLVGGWGKGPAGISCVEPGILLNILQCTSQPRMGQDWETLPWRISSLLINRLGLLPLGQLAMVCATGSHPWTQLLGLDWADSRRNGSHGRLAGSQWTQLVRNGSDRDHSDTPNQAVSQVLWTLASGSQ